MKKHLVSLGLAGVLVGAALTAYAQHGEQQQAPVQQQRPPAAQAAPSGGAGNFGSNAPAANPFPDHPGREIVAVACKQCHGPNVFTQLRMGDKAWRAQIYDMVLRGAQIGPDDIEDALGWDGVAALGEMMNMPGVYGSDDTTHAMIGAVLDAGLPVTGHWSLHGWDDHRLHAYACAGVDSDHETVFCADALAKLRAGMWVQFREGSAWHDVAECVKALTDHGLDSRHALIVTDDMHPGTLARTGHRDVLVLQVRPAAFRAEPRIDPRWTGSFLHHDFNRDPFDLRQHLKTSAGAA